MAVTAKWVQLGPYVLGGNVLTDAKLFHYVAGTLTVLPTYLDQAKTLTLPQPMVTNIHGVFTFYADGAYKFVLTDSAENELDLWDNVVVTEQAAIGVGTPVISANEITLPTDGNIFHVTGNATITRIVGAQPEATLIFDGFPLLTNSAQLALPDAQSIQVVNNSVAHFINEGLGFWRLGTYLRSKQDLGGTPQCRLVKSGANLVLDPYLGNRIPTYDGGGWKTLRIPSGGVSLTDTGVTANTHYYIYAYEVVGVLTLEYATATPTIDPNHGVMIKSTDATRLLVGAARTNASGNWEDTITNRAVLSWYNRRPIIAQTVLSVDYTKTNTAYEEFESAMRANFLTWGGEVVNAQAQYNARISAGTFAHVAISFNSITAPEAIRNSVGAEGANTQLLGQSLEVQMTGLAETTYHYANLLAKANTGATYVVAGTGTEGPATLTVTIQG